MSDGVFWLRFSYWVGAVLDALVGIQMLVPDLMDAVYDLSDFDPGMDYRLAMGMGASLMFGWTCLLVWADRKPVERKGVLLITVFPVIFGMVLTGVSAVTADLIAVERMIPTWISQAVLSVLFVFSYLKARAADQ